MVKRMVQVCLVAAVVVSMPLAVADAGCKKQFNSYFKPGIDASKITRANAEDDHRKAEQYRELFFKDIKVYKQTVEVFNRETERYNANKKNKEPLSAMAGASSRCVNILNSAIQFRLDKAIEYYQRAKSKLASLESRYSQYAREAQQENCAGKFVAALQDGAASEARNVRSLSEAISRFQATRQKYMAAMERFKARKAKYNRMLKQ